MNYSNPLNIRVGQRVTIRNQHGQEHTGRAALLGPAGWVLNMGGPHGTPAIADEQNVVAIAGKRVSPVAVWLKTLGTVKDAKPVTVVIGKETYQGAEYYHEVGEKRFYLLGALPKSYKTKDVYVYDGGEWYIAGYFDKEANEIHRFGPHFLLFRWSLDEKIDKYDRKQRKRMPITVEYK